MFRRTNFFNKKFPKIFTIVFLLLIVLQTGAFVFFTLFHTPTKAEAKWTNPTDHFQLTVFSTPTTCLDDPTKTCIPWIGEYIAGIYNYAIGIVGILAAVVLMFGGVIWLTAGGSQEKVKEAKAWIGASISGLVLALCSYMILYQINPDLIKLNPLKVNIVTELKQGTGCDWKLVGSTPTNPNPTCDAGYIKAADSACSSSGEKPPISATGAMGVSVSTYPICCCLTCKPNIACEECNNCIPAKDSGIDCKETLCSINANLTAKLLEVRNNESDWRVTEGWPPTVNHLDSCHKDGTCIDINFIDKTTDPARVKKLYDLFVAAGLKAVYEHPDCASYAQDPNKVNCKIYETTTSPSFHVEL